MRQIRGVTATQVGYANGHAPSPTYREVCTGATGHAEAVRVTYDPAVLPLATLLDVYLRSIDPLSVNRQGGDRGPQYRTGIYYTDAATQLPVIEASLEAVRRRLGVERLAVETGPIGCFYPAEEYHQLYLDKNPGGYCHIGPGLMQYAREVNREGSGL